MKAEGALGKRMEEKYQLSDVEIIDKRRGGWRGASAFGLALEGAKW